MDKPLINKRNNQEFHFDSISAFSSEVERLHQAQVFDKGAQHASTQNDTDYSWCMNTDLSKALEMGVNGGHWAHGAERLQQACVAAPLALKTQAMEDLELARVGACVDVGEYLNNSPDCFLHFEPVAFKQPVVSILAQCTWSCATSADAIFNRGRAILAIVEALQANGYRVELTGYLMMHNRASPNRAGMEIYIPLKRAQDVYSPQSLAFALAHPAFFRRIMFRFMEAHNAELTNACYGFGLEKDCKPKASAEHDLFFGYQIQDTGFETPESALETALAMVEQFTKKQAA